MDAHLTLVLLVLHAGIQAWQPQGLEIWHCRPLLRHQSAATTAPVLNAAICARWYCGSRHPRAWELRCLDCDGAYLRCNSTDGQVQHSLARCFRSLFILKQREKHCTGFRTSSFAVLMQGQDGWLSARYSYIRHKLQPIRQGLPR